MAISIPHLKQLFELVIEKAKTEDRFPTRSHDRNKELDFLGNILKDKKELFPEENYKLTKTHYRYFWTKHDLGKNNKGTLKVTDTFDIDILCKYLTNDFNCTWREWSQKKKEKEDSNNKVAESTDTIPKELFGAYEGYFLRPFSDGKDEHISKLILLISEPNTVEIKSTVATYSNSDENKCYYKSKDRILTLRFEGKSDKTNELHRFQFNLKYTNEDQNESITLTGIYGGTDPAKGEPVAGKAMLFKINNPSPKTVTLDEVINKHPPTDYISSDNVAELLLVRPQIFDYFVSKNYINSGEKIKYFIGKNKTKKKLLCGSFSIYSLSSDHLFINRGAMHIDQLGNAKIKGSDNCTYTGFVTVFEEKFISILIDTIYDESKTARPYFIHYLLETGLNQQPSIRPTYFVGIRSILFKLKNKTPGAGRVIIQREIGAFYESSEFTQFQIRPSTALNDKIEEDPNQEVKSFYESKELSNDSSEKPSVESKLNYLGDSHKSMMTSSYNEIESDKEDIGTAFFLLALHNAEISHKTNFEKYFQLAIINGLSGNSVEDILSIAKGKARDNKSPLTLKMLSRIKSFSFANQKFFRLE